MANVAVGRVEEVVAVEDRILLPRLLDYSYLMGAFLLLAYALASAWNLLAFPLGFWLLLVFASGSLVARILVGEGSQWRLPLVGTLLLLLALRVSIIHSIPRLYGFDPFAEIRLADSILAQGWDLSGPLYQYYRVTYINPLLFLFGGTVQVTAGLPLEVVAKWVPVVYSLGSLLLLFLMAKLLTRSTKAALLTGVAFAHFHMFLLFHGLFIRESLAFVFFLATIYAYLRARDQRDARMALLAVVFALVTVLTHHMTSLLLGLFFAVVGLAQVVQMASRRRTAAARSDVPSRRNLGILSFGLLVIVASVGYWAFLQYTPIEILVQAVNDAARLQPAFFHAPNTLRTYVLLYGEVAFALVFGLIALAAVVHGVYRGAPWALSLLLWGGLMGLVSVALLQRLITWQNLATTFMASRFQTFGYPFLFILAFGSLAAWSRRRPKVQTLAVVLLVAFVLLGAFRVPPYLFLDEEPNWEAGEERFFITEQEYAALQFPFNVDLRVTVDAFYVNFFSPIRDKFEDVEAVTRMDVPPAGTFDYLFLRDAWLRSASQDVQARYEGMNQLHSRVYDNGQATVHWG